MKKITNLFGTCEFWRSARDTKGRPPRSKICMHCYYNLFAHCWYDERDDKVVSSALNGNDDCKYELLMRTGGI